MNLHNKCGPCGRCGHEIEFKQLPLGYCDWCGSAFDPFSPELHSLINRIEQNSSANAQVPQGGVYLIQCGPHFKIGKANDFSKRVEQIRLQMPEPVVLIHKIFTDDPLGIESYWHKRFAEKRKNGEWFALTEEDIAAFKSRDKM